MSVSISGLEKYNKLSSKLAIPALVAALYIQFGYWAHFDAPDLTAWIDSQSLLVSFSAKCFVFFLSVFVVGMSYHTVNAYLATKKAFLYFFALSLLSFGLLGASELLSVLKTLLTNGSDISSVIHWHIASLLCGFDILNNAEASANNSSKRCAENGAPS